MVIMVSMLIALPSFADDCGKSDRVSLPYCVKKGYGNEFVSIANMCDYPVNLKFDKPGPDKRITFQPKESREFDMPGNATIVSCCPKYSRCF